jgi:hypothetical protein
MLPLGDQPEQFLGGGGHPEVDGLGLALVHARLVCAMSLHPTECNEQLMQRKQRSRRGVPPGGTMISEVESIQFPDKVAASSSKLGVKSRRHFRLPG